MLRFESHFPFGDVFHKRRYIREHLNSLFSVFKNNKDQFCYLKNNKTTHDSLYFINENLNRDIAAAFHALPILENYIGQKLKSLYNSPFPETSEQIKKSELSWTDEKINLVELTYALHYCKCINHGRSHIKQIASGFEQLFNVNMKDYNRVFIDIKSRKKPARFLETLSGSLVKQLELNFN
ncbi:MAG: RteC domain-containing protein [Bacteroidia bacterium]|nr:RteC domain-containing protein [Bacteroidia bacterium]